MKDEFLTMKVSAVKQGNEYEKEGQRHRYDTLTFISPDGDSFKLTSDGLRTPLKVDDVAVFGVRSVMTDAGRPAASLYVASVRAAAFANKVPL